MWVESLADSRSWKKTFLIPPIPPHKMIKGEDKILIMDIFRPTLGIPKTLVKYYTAKIWEIFQCSKEKRNKKNKIRYFLTILSYKNNLLCYFANSHFAKSPILPTKNEKECFLLFELLAYLCIILFKI